MKLTLPTLYSILYLGLTFSDKHNWIVWKGSKTAMSKKGHNKQMKHSSDSSVFAIVILTIVYLLLQIQYEQSSVRQYGLLTNRKNPESSGCPILLPHSKTPKHKHITPEQVSAQPAKQHTNNVCSRIVLLIIKYSLFAK